MLKKIVSLLSENPYTVAVSHVFILALPITMLAACLFLMAELAGVFGWQSASVILNYMGEVTSYLFPILVNFYLASYYASMHRIHKGCAIFCALLGYMFVSYQWGLLAIKVPIPNSLVVALLTAYASCLILHRFKRCAQFQRLTGMCDIWLNEDGQQLYRFVILAASTLTALLLGSTALSLVLSSVISPSLNLPLLNPLSFHDGLIYELVRGFLWGMGIHGHDFLQSYQSGLYDLSVANMADWRNLGDELNIISTNFYDFFTGIGGAGNTLGLVLCILLFGRCEGYRLLAKIVLIFSLFNINEPILFGIPVILNPIMLIPFMLTPLLSYLLAYSAISSGLIAPLTEVQPWITPPVLSGYLASGGEWSVALFQLGLIGLSMLFYYPFFRIMDNQAAGHSITVLMTNRMMKNDGVDSLNRVTGYFPSMQLHMMAQREIDMLRKQGQFALYYQPQVDSHSGRIVAVEALLRHIGADGAVTPPSFLSSYERLGLMAEVDDWVLKHAIADFVKLGRPSGCRLCINVSSASLAQPAFADRVCQTVVENGLIFSDLCLEIREEGLVQDPRETAKMIAKLRARGIAIALDNFGSGYASLAHLSRFTFDRIKIDRSLIGNSGSDKGKSLFSVAVQLGAMSEAEVVVEGIEKAEQLMLAREQGASCVQGYYFFQPMPVQALSALKTWDAGEVALSS